MRNVTVAMLALSGALVLGGTAFAQSTTAAPAAPATTATPATTAAAPAAPITTAAADADEIVCKSMDAPTGTRLGSRRICHTNAQWEDIRRQDEQNTASMEANGFKNSAAGH